MGLEFTFEFEFNKIILVGGWHMYYPYYKIKNDTRMFYRCLIYIIILPLFAAGQFIPVPRAQGALDAH